MTTPLVLDGIEQATWICQREGVADLTRLVHSTDRVNQYTSIESAIRLTEAGIERSVEATGSSYDNALAETINSLYEPNRSAPERLGRRPSRSKSTWNGSAGSTTAASLNTARPDTCQILASS